MTLTETTRHFDFEPRDERLTGAQDAFRAAHRLLEEAREDLLKAHIAASRLWSSGHPSA